MPNPVGQVVYYPNLDRHYLVVNITTSGVQNVAPYRLGCNPCGYWGERIGNPSNWIMGSTVDKLLVVSRPKSPKKGFGKWINERENTSTMSV